MRGLELKRERRARDNETLLAFHSVEGHNRVGSKKGELGEHFSLHAIEGYKKVRGKYSESFDSFASRSFGPRASMSLASLRLHSRAGR